MAKIAKVQEVSLPMLVPYTNNAKEHDIEKLKNSIKEFGFLSPCLIDKDYNIIAGHGRVQAAKELKLEKVPCVFIEGLTEEQRRAYILADNKLTELGGWNEYLLNIELGEIENIDMGDFGFSIRSDWFDSDDKGEAEEGEDEYSEFLDKFEAKHTTDDCYTPEVVYNAVKEWVVKEYGIKEKDIVRPFYPGGDYKSERYLKNSVVLDNPPFSILQEITDWYNEQNIKYFLFAPGLTCFKKGTAICLNVTITYENKANVGTSFVTNLDDPDVVARTAPDLYKLVKKAVDEFAKSFTVELPKYSYPDCIATVAMLSYMSSHDTLYSFRRESSCFIRQLESQKEQDKAIFGGGYLLSEKAAAEKAAAEKAAAEKAAAEKAEIICWELSPAEIEIQKTLK